MPKAFSIKGDLQTRPLAQQVEILWISGPTCKDAAKIAKILGVSKARVLALVPKRYL